MKSSKQQLRKPILFFSILLLLLTAGAVGAAEVITNEESWTLTPSQTIDDDLYINADEVIIEGTVNGDVVALGEYLRIQGEVNGDVIFLGGGVRVDGVVNGDVRAAALSIEIIGEVTDDLTAASFGIIGFDDPLRIGENRSLTPGTRVVGGTIGDDIYGYSGIGLIKLEEATVNGDILGQASGLELVNSQVAGSVDLSVLQIVADEESRILGPNGLSYRSTIPAEVSTLTDNIQFEAIEPPPTDWIGILRTVVGRAAGFAIVGWVILRFRPNWLVEPVAAINTRTVWASWLGLTIAGTAFFAAFGLAILISFFWGGLAALVFSGFILFTLGTIWFMSPLITGFWLGQRFSEQPFQGLMIGSIVLVIFQMVPLFGLGVSLFSFVLALGGLVLAPRIEDLPSQV